MTLDQLIPALRDLTEYSDAQTANPVALLGLADTGRPETSRDRTRRLRSWRRLLQEIPLDERSFDDRFGLDGRAALIAALSAWCRGYRAESDERRTRLAGLFGFTGLLLVTLLSLAESEAQRSAAHAPAAPARQGRALTHDCADTCGALVTEPAVARAIAEVYRPDPPAGGRRSATAGGPAEQEWAAVEQEPLSFHRHGSTSLILRGVTSRAVHGNRLPFALKLIIYPFTKFPIIAHATREYAQRYGNPATGARHLVHVWASFDSWILMDFVAGKTLAETVNEERAREAAGGEESRSLRLDRLGDRGRRLFEALEELQTVARAGPSPGPSPDRFPGVHADLSPSNIIVSDVDGSFQLIDLGRNYLYTHTVTGTTGTDAAYIAPEVRAGDSEIGRADLYSVGQLLVLIGCGRTSTDGVVPDIFYMRAMLLARFVEDLVDADPGRRLLIFPAGAGPDFSFTELKNSFLAELEMTQAAERGADVLRVETGLRASRELLRPLAGDPGREWRLWRMRRQQSLRPAANRGLLANWLLAWSFVAAAVWAVTNTVVITWLLRDLNLGWGNRTVELVQHLTHDPTGLPVIDAWRRGDYHVPDWQANLPARIVGFSYALAAPKYYEIISSGLTPLVVGRRVGAMSWLALATEAVMRMMALLPCALVLAVTLVEPRWWPVNSAIGQVSLCLTNYMTLFFARTAIARSRRLGLSTVPADDSKITGLSSFAQWAPTSLFYAAAVLTIGVLLYTHVLEDTYVYALGAAATNIFVFYVIKTGIGGPMIRVVIVRSHLAAERVARASALPPPPPRP